MMKRMRYNSKNRLIDRITTLCIKPLNPLVKSEYLSLASNLLEYHGNRCRNYLVHVVEFVVIFHLHFRYRHYCSLQFIISGALLVRRVVLAPKFHHFLIPHANSQEAPKKNGGTTIETCATTG